MFRARNIPFEVAERTQAICYGGIGLMHSLARECGLIEAIDHNVELLKVHFPYHESDHVLNIAYNALTDGRCLEEETLRPPPSALRPPPSVLGLVDHFLRVVLPARFFHSLTQIRLFDAWKNPVAKSGVPSPSKSPAIRLR